MIRRHHSAIGQLVKTALHLVGDPELPISFRRADEAGVAPVAAACEKPAGTLHTPRRALNRNAFLRGCLEATDGHGLEYLIVGFGQRRGSTTTVESISHDRGTEHSVGIPTHIRSAIIGHIASARRNEVLLFHNHPPNWLNAVFDNQPLPSLQDRATLTDFHKHPVLLLKALSGGGRLRFYLGENGSVREFRTPHLPMVMDWLERLGVLKAAQL
jgi:hypothetical protein